MYDVNTFSVTQYRDFTGLLVGDFRVGKAFAVPLWKLAMSRWWTDVAFPAHVIRFDLTLAANRETLRMSHGTIHCIFLHKEALGLEANGALLTWSDRRAGAGASMRGAGWSSRAPPWGPGADASAGGVRGRAGADGGVRRPGAGRTWGRRRPPARRHPGTVSGPTPAPAPCPATGRPLQRRTRPSAWLGRANTIREITWPCRPTHRNHCTTARRGGLRRAVAGRPKARRCTDTPAGTSTSYGRTVAYRNVA